MGFFAKAQEMELIENDLLASFQKINAWSQQKDNVSSYDSLEVANDKFEELLLKYTSFEPKTLHSSLVLLDKAGLTIKTSSDGKFRIYSWDTQTGGTMRYFRNVFQYQNGEKVFSKTLENRNENLDDPLCVFYQIDDLKVGDKTYYITQSISIFSTALSYHNLNIFAISGDSNLEESKLIKTSSGLHNQLGYEVDLIAQPNRGREIKNTSIDYNPKIKIISIPLIWADGKITSKRILYKFNGKYFEKI
ncbi:MAG: hypothetical protein C4K58_06565 [Flavobacteriaceae bacterium]|nr:MAG: hypothetical protein C4K58_06565 [Flavobacteriaceae bacterium]